MKTCCSCKEEKPLTQFNKNKSKKDGYNNMCKDCSRSSSKKYYANNKERYKEVSNKRRNEHRSLLREIANEAKSQGCVLCDESSLCCLDFHHKDPSEKEGTISVMIASTTKKEKVIDEISKCVVLCSNCHRKVHAGELQI